MYVTVYLNTGKSCEYDADNQIDEMKTSSVDSCLSFCQSLDSCTNFVWFSEESLMSDYCYLFSSECDAMYDCGSCQSGTLNCLFYPFTPTTDSPSTSTAEDTTIAKATTKVEATETIKSVTTTKTEKSAEATTIAESSISTTAIVLPEECFDYLILDD